MGTWKARNGTKIFPINYAMVDVEGKYLTETKEQFTDAYEEIRNEAGLSQESWFFSKFKMDVPQDLLAISKNFSFIIINFWDK